MGVRGKSNIHSNTELAKFVCGGDCHVQITLTSPRAIKSAFSNLLYCHNDHSKALWSRFESDKNMMNPSLNDCRRQLDRFCRQYLQVKLDLDYPTDSCLRQDAAQEEIFHRLFDKAYVKYTPPLRYQLKVLKELMRRIEGSIQDWEEEVCTPVLEFRVIPRKESILQSHLIIHLCSHLSLTVRVQGLSENLMNHLSSLLGSVLPSDAASAQQQSYVTYTLSSLCHLSLDSSMVNPCDPSISAEPPESSSLSADPPVITLYEHRNLLAASGTTGLRTWEASLHLANYLISNPSLIKSKSVLELGAGTGFISILCARHLSASQVLATDGSADVISSLPTNIYLNNLQSSALISATQLKWGHALIGGENPQLESSRGIDVVLGADLTYDSMAISGLITTFGDLFDLYPNIRIVYGGTVRNLTTFEGFLAGCESAGFVVEDIEWPIVEKDMQEGPFYEDRVPIRICEIRRPVKTS